MEHPIESEIAQRRGRTVNRLKAQGLRLPAAIPSAPKMNDCRRRAAGDVADRILVLVVVAMRASGAGADEVGEMVRKLGLLPKLTARERAFIEAVDVDPEQATDLQWRWESVETMLWSLGLVEDLGRPDHECDVGVLSRLLEKLGRAGIAAGDQPRLDVELLDLLDELLCQEAAVAAAQQLGKRPPARLVPGVVEERLEAIEWLLSLAEWE